MTIDPEAPPVRRKRRWLRYTLWTFLTLLVVGVAFHRPILVAVIRWAGAWAAEKQGLDLAWQVKGSVLGDLEISSFKTSGKDQHWLPRAELKQFAVDYNLRALMRGDLEKAIQSVTLHDGEIELDLRYLPKKKERIPLPPGTVKTKTLVWPEVIDLVNVNTTLTLANGKRLVLRGLTLQVGKGMPGIFACRELRMEPDGLALGPLHAEVQLESRKATIRNLILPQDVVIEQIAADLTQWDKGKLNAKVNARLGEARVDATLEIDRLMQASIQLHRLRATELHTLGLPKEVQFDGGELTLNLSGNHRDTATLKGDMKFAASNLRAVGTLFDRLEMAIDLDQGTALLKSAHLTRGKNRIEATGRAVLPANLAEWRKLQWQAQANASLTDFAEFLARPPDITGAYAVTATAEGLGPTPVKVTGEIQAEAPAFQAFKLPQLRTTFTLDGRQARIEVPALTAGAGNTVNLSAALLLQDAMPIEATWNIAITDPAAFFAATGLKAPPKVLLGKMQSEGKAKFEVKALRARDFATITADVTLKGGELKYGEGQVRSVDLQAAIQGGKVAVHPLVVRLDDQNEVRLEATAALAAPFAFEADGVITLPQMTALNGLLKTFNLPPLESGGLFGKVDGTGQLRPWQSTGRVSLSASKVRTVKMPEAADAVVDATFEGTRADLAKFEVTLGPWKIDAQGIVDDKHANLAQLQVWHRDTRLLNGRAQAPFDVMRSGTGPPMDVAVSAKDLRVDQLLAAAGIENIPAGLLNADIQLHGRAETAVGKVHVEVKDVKIPKGPKSFGPASSVLDLTLADKRAKVLLTVVQPPLKPLTLTADIPVNASEIAKAPNQFRHTPLTARLDMPESDLGFLREYAPDLIHSIPAKLKISADVRGTIGAPLVDAALDLTAPEIVWSKADLPSVRDLRVRIRATDRKLRVEDASVLLAGGRVRITGNVDATDIKQPTVDLSVEAREALLYRNPTTSMRADGNLTCRGTLASAHVAGQIELVRGRLFKEIDFMPALSLPSDVPPLPPDTHRRDARFALPVFFKDWTFDVRARTRDQFLISGNVANGAVSVDATLVGTGAAPVITGGATVDRLLLKLPYSVVKVTQGYVTLNPDKPFDPALDIRGESRVGSTDVTIYVYGDSSDPKTRFTSIPPMSEADVAALLATGTSLNGSSSEVAADAAGRAAFLFLKELYRKALKKKKVVREDPPRMAVTVNPSGTDTANGNVEVTYELNEQLRATARFSQSGRVRGFLAYLIRFGEAARAVDAQPKPNLARTAPNGE